MYDLAVEREDWAKSFEAIASAAVASGRVVPLASDDQDRRWWRACDVASVVEGCFQEQLNATTLSAADEQSWIERFRGQFRFGPAEPLHKGDLSAERFFWLASEGERIGTVRLSFSPQLGPWLFVQSLYVFPEARGRGFATALLQWLAMQAKQRSLFGIRLGTYWTWQKSVRFYLSRGFWVRSWKHDLQLLLSADRPAWRCHVEGATASFHVVEDGREHCVFTAAKVEDRLALEESDPERRSAQWEFWTACLGTFAMCLAVRGWPLVRSELEWARRYSGSDFGPPEGLAYKIGVFEDVARRNGWVVDTPTIAGLHGWQQWARGEMRGQHGQLVDDLLRVVSARGWSLTIEQKERLKRVELFVSGPALLYDAVNATSFDTWWEHVEREVPPGSE